MSRQAEHSPSTDNGIDTYGVESSFHALHFRPIKQQITLRVDSDVIAWFRANHPRYQTLMNAVLRKEMTQALAEEQRERLGRTASGS